jgi:hypothetical protein
MVPAASLPLIGKSTVVATTTTRAAATPAPITTLPLVVCKKPFCCSLMISSSDCCIPRELRRMLAIIPGRVSRASAAAAAITPERQKGWRQPSRRDWRSGILVIAESTRPSGGSISTTWPRTANNSRNRSNCWRTLASPASNASSCRTSSAEASPSRTVCISAV